MGAKTEISWTNSTWNPVRGCSRVSEGCRHCYAEKIAARFSDKDRPFHLFADRNKSGSKWTGKVAIVEEHLNDPLRWRKPRRIFVNSMSDLFHENLPYEAIDRVFAVMAMCPQHTFQCLSKRPERMRQYIGHIGHLLSKESVPYLTWPLPNVWLGVSVENQATADERIPLLLQTPAAVRFISAEPLLAPVDFSPWMVQPSRQSAEKPGCPGAIHLIICGGESGPGARPMHPDWARSIRDQCQAAGIPFFFKQWGAFTPNSSTPPGQKYPDTSRLVTRSGLPSVGVAASDVWMHQVGKKAAGTLLDGREWKEFPEASLGR